MKNKKGKSFLGMLLLLIAIGVFGYFGYSTMNQIKLGLDLAGGVSITYQAKEENPSSEDMADLEERCFPTLAAVPAACTELQYRGGGLPGG